MAAFQATLPSQTLETGIQSCLRITTNFSCHFTCKYCYVIPLLEERQIPKKNCTVLTEEDWTKFFRMYIETMVSQGNSLGFPISICATDPAKNPEVLEMILRVCENETRTINRWEEFAKNSPVTVIIECATSDENLKRVTDVLRQWKGAKWLASTVQVVNGRVSRTNVHQHRRLKKRCDAVSIGWASIATSSYEPARSRASKTELTETIQLLHTLALETRQGMFVINSALPVNTSAEEDILGYRQEFVRLYLSFFSFWLQEYLRFRDDLESSFSRGNIYTLLSEVGIIPGLSQVLNNGPRPDAFGCWSATSCFQSILGIEPNGKLSACQFGVAPIKDSVQQLSSWSQDIVRSTERLHVLRQKLSFPFTTRSTKHCTSTSKRCREAECGAFLRGGCPADLYYQHKSLSDASVSCKTFYEVFQGVQVETQARGVRLEDLADEILRESNETIRRSLDVS